MQLDLGGRGHLTQPAASTPHATGPFLPTAALPRDPQIQVHHYLEANTTENASCHIDDAFPENEVQLSLSFAGHLLFSNVTTSGTVAMAKIASRAPGKYELNCTVSVGPLSRSTVVPIKVYSEWLGCVLGMSISCILWVGGTLLEAEASVS